MSKKNVTSFPVNSAYSSGTKAPTRLMIKPEEADKNGFCNIYVEVTTYEPKRKLKRINTGEKVRPADWSVAKKKVKDKLPQAESINGKIERYEDAVKGFFKSAIWEDAYKLPIPTALMKLERQFRKRKNLLSYIDDYVEVRKKNSTRETWKEFLTIRNKLEKFQKTNYELFFESIDNKFARDFKFFSDQEGEDPNYTAKQLITLGTILTHFYQDRIKLNITLTDEFKSKRFKAVSGTHDSEPSPLYIDELLKLERWKPKKLQGKNEKGKTIYVSEEAANKIKRLFLIGCYCGLRISDVLRLKPSHIVNGHIVVKPRKTDRKNIKVQVPIIDTLNDILITTDYDTSLIAVAKPVINRSIKLILKDSGINTPTAQYTYYQSKSRTEKTVPKYEIITFHSGRDSFITNALISGIPAETVMKWSGHTKYETFKKYVLLSDLYLTQQSDKLKAYYKKMYFGLGKLEEAELKDLGIKRIK